MNRKPLERFILAAHDATNAVVIAGILILALMAVARASGGGTPECRVLEYEPTRDSTARLYLTLTQPDASSTQRLTCTCRE